MNEGFVYICRRTKSTSGLVKIGHTDNLDRRMMELNRETGSDSPMLIEAAFVCPAGQRQRLEAAAHSLGHHARRRGEWFKLEAEAAIDLVRRAAQQHGIRAAISYRHGQLQEITDALRAQTDCAFAERVRLEAERVRLEAEHAEEQRRLAEEKERSIREIVDCEFSIIKAEVIKKGAKLIFDRKSEILSSWNREEKPGFFGKLFKQGTRKKYTIVDLETSFDWLKDGVPSEKNSLGSSINTLWWSLRDKWRGFPKRLDEYVDKYEFGAEIHARVLALIVHQHVYVRSREHYDECEALRREIYPL